MNPVRHMEPSEYPSFLLRMLEAYGRKVASADTVALAEMVAVYEKFDQIVKASATTLSESGVSWNEIGAALEIPSTTARDRWQVRSIEPRGPVVYGLREQDTTEIRYVGASRNVSARLAQHRSQAYRGNAPVYTWVRRISVQRLELVILERLAPGQDLAAVEQTWIIRLSEQGHRLTNVTDNPFAPRDDADGSDERLADDWRASRERRAAERRVASEKRAQIAREGYLDEQARILARREEVDISPFWKRERARVMTHAELFNMTPEHVKRLTTTELWPLVLKAREAARA